MAKLRNNCKFERMQNGYIMKNTARMVVFVLISLSALTCVGPITGEDKGKTYEFPLNTPFTVALKGMAGSPLVWRPYSFDSTVIRQKGAPEIRCSQENGREYRTFRYTFQTVAAGKTQLQMAYTFPDDREAIPAKMFRIHIIAGTFGRIESHE